MSIISCVFCLREFYIILFHSYPFYANFKYRHVSVNGTSNLICNFNRLANVKTPRYSVHESELPRGLTNHKDPKHRTGVGSYFATHEAALTRCHWQVIVFFP